MSSDKIKDVINGIINDSFKVITNVYKYQKESKPENFIVPTGESFIIFPKLIMITWLFQIPAVTPFEVFFRHV